MCAYVTYTYTCIGKIDVYTPHAHTHTHVCHASDRGIAEYSKGGSASVCANKKRLLNLCDKMNLVNDIIYSPIQSLFITGKKKRPLPVELLPVAAQGKPRVRGGGALEAACKSAASSPGNEGRFKPPAPRRLPA